MQGPAHVLADIVDLERLQHMCDGLAAVSGMALAVLEPDGVTVAASGWQDICTRFHRLHAETLRECLESDLQITRRLLDGFEAPEHFAYKCTNGLWDVALPLIVDGQHLATVFTGQFFYDDDEIDVEAFRRRAGELGFDEASYLDALARVPVLSHERVAQTIGFLGDFVGVLAETGLSALQHTRERDALQESEERYRQLFEVESDAVFLIDNETGRILEANGAASALYGYSRDELMALTNEDLSAEPEKTQARTHGTPVVADNVVTIPLRIHRKKDGSTFTVEITGRFFVREGRAVHVAAIRDITARVHGEEALRVRGDELDALLTTSRAIVSSLDYDNVLFEVARAAGEALGSSECIIWEYLAEGDLAVFHCLWQRHPVPGAVESQDGLSYDINEHTGGLEGLRSGAITQVSISDADLSPSDRQTMEKWGEKTCLYVPLVSERGLLGLLILIETETEREFTAKDVQLAKAIGEQAAVALDHARLYHEQAERSRRLDALVQDGRQVAANLDAVFESSPVALLILDDTTNIVRANTAAVVLCGGSGSDVQQHRPGNALRCVHSSEDPRGCGYSPDCLLCPARNGIEALLANGGTMQGAELALALVRDGEPREVWLELGAEPLLMDGRRHLCVAMQDVTERKRADERLRESELKYRTLFETANDAILLFADGRWVDCNAGALSVFGCTREQIIGAHPSKFSPPMQPDGRSSEEEAVRRIDLAFASGPQSFEWEHCRADGAPFAAEVNLSRLDLGGKPHMQAIVRDVSARRQADEALRDSEEQFSALIRQSNEGITVVAEDGAITIWNGSMVALTGIEECEAVGSPVWEVQARMVPEGQKTPELLGQLQAGFESAVGSTPDWQGASREQEIMRVDGMRRVVQAASFIVRTETVLRLSTIFHDITERKQAEESLRRSEERNRAVLETAMDGFWVVGEGGRLLAINEAYCRMSGYSEQELLSMRISDVEDEETAAETAAHISAIMSHGEDRFESRHRRKDGSQLDVEISVQYRSGEDGWFVAFLRDITERQRAEREIRRLNADLELRVARRTVELEAANRELESFSYSVSHDLRAPLRALDGFSQILLDDYGKQLDEKGRGYLERIRAADQRMGALIDALLDLSRLSRGELRRESVDLSELARRVTTELAEAEPGRAVEFVVADGLEAEADGHLVRSLLTNLLGNAWKFTAGHEAARIEVGALDVDGERAFYVRDDGAGFDMAYADKLFGAFQRLHSPGQFEGLGIGLATAQRIVHRHGGRVWAEGAVEKGATFHFTLSRAGDALREGTESG